MKKRISAVRELHGFLLLWASQTVSALGTAMMDYALAIWVYGQRGTASSLTLLTLCGFMPTILFRFIAGTIADRWDKKRVMLLADLLAACGTALVFALYSLSALRIWHLYLINILLSFMNAFQAPAAFVATSLLVPEKHYTRVSGLQGFSGSVVSILAPALGSALLAFGGLLFVLTCDLVSFAVAFFTLLFFIRIPDVARGGRKDRKPFMESCLDGVRYLRGHSALLRLTLFLTLVNFLAKLGNDGMLSPFVLARTGNDQRALGAVQSAVAFGLLAGSLFMTLKRPTKDKVKAIFMYTAVVFSGNIVLSLTRWPWLWCIVNFYAYAMAAVMGANLTAVMRERVPLDRQGRVFSAQDTLKNGAIPLGLFLGGVLADRVFEPFMAADSPLQRPLSRFFGSGNGAGIAMMFFFAGVFGVALCLSQLKKPVYRRLDEEQSIN